MRKGRWSQQSQFKNCGSESCLQGCADDPSIKPHGPYFDLRRRNPDTGEQDRVYLGKVSLSPHQLQLVNDKLNGPSVPEKAQVLEVAGISP